MSISEKVQPAETRRAQKERTRQAILEAAADIFAERGFDGASLPAIARRAGVNVPLIVYHFSTKLGLWEEAVSHVFARLQDAQLSEAGDVGSLSGMPFLRGMIRAHLRALIAEPRYMRILFLESVAETDRLHWLVETHQRAISGQTVALIELAQKEGFLLEADPVHLKYVLSGALSLPITLAPEYRVMTGEDPTQYVRLEAHIDQCMALLFRQKKTATGFPVAVSSSKTNSP